jgi:hypothetical protein
VVIRLGDGFSGEVFAMEAPINGQLGEISCEIFFQRNLTIVGVYPVSAPACVLHRYPNMHRSIALQFSLAVLGLLLPAGIVRGVDPPFADQGNANLVTEFKGTLKGFQRGVILVTREDGTEMMVQPPDDVAAFQFIAPAKPAFLQRGTMVRFSGTFDLNGRPQEQIKRVEIFQPITGQVAGHHRESFLPDVYPDHANRGKPPMAIANYSVVGGVIGMDATGVMMVQAGARQVRVQLAPDVELEVKVNNLSLAQEGDPITVAGFYQPADETKVKADRVTIRSDRVYGDPATNTKPKRRTSRTEKAKAEEAAADGTAEKPAGEAGEVKE